jgi:hypothetical protein
VRRDETREGQIFMNSMSVGRLRRMLVLVHPQRDRVIRVMIAGDFPISKNE